MLSLWIPACRPSPIGIALCQYGSQPGLFLLLSETQLEILPSCCSTWNDLTKQGGICLHVTYQEFTVRSGIWTVLLDYRSLIGSIVSVTQGEFTLCFSNAITCRHLFYSVNGVCGVLHWQHPGGGKNLTLERRKTWRTYSSYLRRSCWMHLLLNSIPVRRLNCVW